MGTQSALFALRGEVQQERKARSYNKKDKSNQNINSQCDIHSDSSQAKDSKAGSATRSQNTSSPTRHIHHNDESSSEQSDNSNDDHNEGLYSSDGDTPMQEHNPIEGLNKL